MQFHTVGLIGYGKIGKVFSAGLGAQAGVRSVGAGGSDPKNQRISGLQLSGYALDQLANE